MWTLSHGPGATRCCSVQRGQHWKGNSRQDYGSVSTSTAPGAELSRDPTGKDWGGSSPPGMRPGRTLCCRAVAGGAAWGSHRAHPLLPQPALCQHCSKDWKMGINGAVVARAAPLQKSWFTVTKGLWHPCPEAPT